MRAPAPTRHGRTTTVSPVSCGEMMYRDTKHPTVCVKLLRPCKKQQSRCLSKNERHNTDYCTPQTLNTDLRDDQLEGRLELLNVSSQTIHQLPSFVSVKESHILPETENTSDMDCKCNRYMNTTPAEFVKQVLLFFLWLGRCCLEYCKHSYWDFCLLSYDKISAGSQTFIISLI